MVLLGVNIDHVATVRNARGGKSPDPLEAALIAEDHGADAITVHLREDRRHIKDKDLKTIRQAVGVRLNLEMAATTEMLDIALEIRPDMVTLVPEKRQELTTEGGLDVIKNQAHLSSYIKMLTDSGIWVSLFVDPNNAQLHACHQIDCKMVELHTGRYAEAFETSINDTEIALNELIEASLLCAQMDIKLNAGHGLNYENVVPILRLPRLIELNIGHSIISRAIFVGLGQAVGEMKALLNHSQNNYF